MKIEQTDVLVSRPDGQMPAVLVTPIQLDRQPAVLLLMEVFGVTSHIRDIATRIAHEGYSVLIPDLYACRFSNEIAAAASFYGVVLDEWLNAVKDITVPMYLFFGGRDSFISSDRIQQIDTRFQELNKHYILKIYPDAGHGFFCDERSDFNPIAAADAWVELKRFLRKHL